jgi:hypothetical protein
MLRELRAADTEVAGWRKLMQEILACEQRDLEGIAIRRRGVLAGRPAPARGGTPSPPPPC